MPDELEFLVHFNRTLCISLPANDATLDNIKAHIQTREHVPAEKLELFVNGRKLLPDALLPSVPVVLRARMKDGLLGGKGGFGAMLRSQGKGSGTKVTTNFGACRDLHGRRLRHVNQEIAMQKWKEDSEIRELQKKQGITEREVIDEETPSGIPGWYLAAPSWAEGIKKSYMKRRRNTVLCKNWLQARENGRTPPPNAPRWWGCPRGRDCDFAHGEEELRGAGLTEFKKAKKDEVYHKKQQELHKYVNYELDMPDDLNDAIRQGLRKRNVKKGKTDVLVAEARVLPPNATYISVRSSDVAEESWLVPMGGNVGTTFKHGLCEVRGQSNFGTATVFDCNVTSGKWYYEVRLVTDGVIQLGWADGTFDAKSASGDGVGDHVRSWSYDGCRQLKWTNGEEIEYGSAWERNDLIGCLLNLDDATISFSKNGVDMGVAFEGVKCLETDNLKQKGFFPAISVEESEILLINIGAQPFLHQPDGYRRVIEAIQSEQSNHQAEDTQKLTENGLKVIIEPTLAANHSSPSTDPNPPAKPQPAPSNEKKHVEPIDLDKFQSPEDLVKLGLNALKDELQRRNLKCGGSVEERAKRLFSVRGKSWDEIDVKLKVFKT